MKKVFGLKIGGLQHKIFNLALIIIIAMVAVFLSVSIYQQNTLTRVVGEASENQQKSITDVSENTMKSVLESTMGQTVGLEAYIADDLFSDVKSDVMTLHTFAEELFRNRDRFPDHEFFPPDKANDGIPSAQVQHEEGIAPADSKDLSLVANMSDIMISMFKNSDKLSSCFIATTDGNILFVDDRAGAYITEDGKVEDFAVRSRPWYKQAVKAGKLIFTGVELDAFTGIRGVVCAAPVYKDGKLVAVVGADLFLTSMQEYVESTASQGGFVCIVDQNGHVIFSAQEEGTFKSELSNEAADLREMGNTELADFVNKALKESTGLTSITADGKEYYMAGAPMQTVGWTCISAVEKEITHQPTQAMLDNYEKINDDALANYSDSAQSSIITLIIALIVIIILAITGAVILSKRTVRPLEYMTNRINALSGSDAVFEMEKIYETKDEIEVLAQSFAQLSERTRSYITQITQITAEKERIGAELSLATKIQENMLPNLFPAFPEREEFDVYASMTPAKEVGGDFYDFFLIDDDHLGMVMADVSGKGVPAALFMMASKIILKNYAMSGKSPAEVLEAANNQICANNKEEMFVTVWFGKLDIKTGVITAANAGHEYPFIGRKDKGYEILKDKHGFVIGGMEGMTFDEYEIQLNAGDSIFLYTDGVAEATDANNELFGTDMMLEALNKYKDASPRELLIGMRSEVDEFVGDAPQFDDLTMLSVKMRK